MFSSRWVVYMQNAGYVDMKTSPEKVVKVIKEAGCGVHIKNEEAK